VIRHIEMGPEQRLLVDDDMVESISDAKRLTNP
jgi:hypothetical protein